MNAGKVRRLLAVLAIAVCSSAAGSAAARQGGAEPTEPKAAGQAPEGHEHGAHQDEHGGHGPGQINWIYGFIGEREGAEPSLLFRPKGMPAPFGAMLLNAAILFYLLGRYGAPQVRHALVRRKAAIMHGMDEAQKMKEEAQKSLAQYEQKLERIDEDIARLRKDMQEAGELERTRMLNEAKDRRARMERDARLLIEFEFKAVHEELLRKTVESAVRSAENRLLEQVTAADQQRIAEQYLQSIGSAFGSKA